MRLRRSLCLLSQAMASVVDTGCGKVQNLHITNGIIIARVGLSCQCYIFSLWTSGNPIGAWHGMQSAVAHTRDPPNPRLIVCGANLEPEVLGARNMIRSTVPRNAATKTESRSG